LLRVTFFEEGFVHYVRAQGKFMPISIKELADQTGFKGPISHRRAEPGEVRGLPVIDNSDSFSTPVRTSVDCYVSGTYVQPNGRTMEVQQRYTVFVAYNKDSQFATMNMVRDRIVRDFEDKYGKSFNVSNVFVPDLPVPVDAPPKPEAGDAEMYGGSRLFREMTKYEKARYEVAGERLKADVNIRSIKARYGLKR
jgi:hypothetical protein